MARLDLQELKKLHPSARIKALKALLAAEASKEMGLQETEDLLHNLLQEAEEEWAVLAELDSKATIVEMVEELEEKPKEEPKLERIAEEASEVTLTPQQEAYAHHLAYETAEQLHDRAVDIRDRLYQNPQDQDEMDHLRTVRAAMYKKEKQYKPDQKARHLMTAGEQIIEDTYQHTQNQYQQ